MSLITRMRKQIVVYWGGPVDDGRGGQSFDVPVEVACRYEESGQEFIESLTMQKIVSHAIVMSPDRDLVYGGMVLHGRLTDLTTEEKADPIGKLRGRAWPVRRWEAVPNLRGNQILKIAYLSPYMR